MKQIKILNIGHGFMGGKAHSHAILEANQRLRGHGVEFVLDCLAGRNEKTLAETQLSYGYNRISTDWEKELKKADLVIVTTPNKEHAPMSLAALEAGKPDVCEKPLRTRPEPDPEIGPSPTKACVLS